MKLFFPLLFLSCPLLMCCQAHPPKVVVEPIASINIPDKLRRTDECVQVWNDYAKNALEMDQANENWNQRVLNAVDVMVDHDCFVYDPLAADRYQAKTHEKLESFFMTLFRMKTLREAWSVPDNLGPWNQLMMAVLPERWLIALSPYPDKTREFEYLREKANSEYLELGPRMSKQDECVLPFLANDLYLDMFPKVAELKQATAGPIRSEASQRNTR